MARQGGIASLGLSTYREGMLPPTMSGEFGIAKALIGSWIGTRQWGGGTFVVGAAETWDLSVIKLLL